MSSAKIDLLTLGESMIRFSTPATERLESAHAFDLHIGGAESNVAIGLAHLGKRSAWWSRLPDNPLGRKIANAIQAHGVDVSGIAWATASERVGVYFAEFGNPPRPTQVIYDRANSAASKMSPKHFDWLEFRRAFHLHLTGITPALSDSCLETVKTAIEKATLVGIPISLDINYRAKLWTPERAAQVLDELAKSVTWVIAAERDLKALFSLSGDSQAVITGAYARWQKAGIIMTSSSNGAYGINPDGQELTHVPAFAVSHPMPIGAGDAFAAGWLFGLLEGKPLEESLRFGNAMAALKLTMPGDAAIVTRAEVEALMRSSSGGGVQR